MKRYILLTTDIQKIGGMELYACGKLDWLKRNGWRTHLLYSGALDGACAVPGLEAYRREGVKEFSLRPCIWGAAGVRRVLDRIERLLGPESAEQTVIESPTSTLALWGELLAERLHGRHVCMLCNETFVGRYKYYQNYLDFFDFKHRRRELFGIGEGSLPLLFEGYKELKPEERYRFFAAPADPVQDVPLAAADAPERRELMIGCIGRMGKDYVPGILRGVQAYAKKHPEQSVGLVLVGDAAPQRKLLGELFEGRENVAVTELGDLVPIPRSLFAKLDLVIAGSGSALCAAYEGVPTIVADAETLQANGLLGYDTASFLYADEGAVVSDFCTAIERVVTEKPQERKPFLLPPRKSAADCYAEHLELLEQAEPELAYYPAERLLAGKRDHKAIWKLRLSRTRLFRASAGRKRQN